MKTRKLALFSLVCSAQFLLGCDVPPQEDLDNVSGDPSSSEESVETSTHALDPITGATLLKWMGYMEKAWSHFNRIDSFYNGETVNLAAAIDNAKEEILKEMRGVAETSLITRTEGAVNNYSQILTAIQKNPDATTLMAQRIPDWLNTTTQTWVDMKSALEKGDFEHAYRVLPAFNTLSTVRASMLKSMSQLRPPMPVSQETIDKLLHDTLILNYRMIGAPVVRLPPPIAEAQGEAFRPVSFFVRNTVRGKKIAAKFFSGYQPDDRSDKVCDSVCGGSPYHNVCSWEARRPCYLKNEADTMAKMAADGVVRMAQAMMRGISASGRFPVYDPFYFNGEGLIPGASTFQLK